MKEIIRQAVTDMIVNEISLVIQNIIEISYEIFFLRANTGISYIFFLGETWPYSQRKKTGKAMSLQRNKSNF
jgi:hypothetical protein